MKHISELIPLGYTKQTLTRSHLENFQQSITLLYNELKDNTTQNEEFHKNNINKFLTNSTLNQELFKNIDYKLKEYKINVYNKVDLAVYYKDKKSDTPYLIIETKDPYSKQKDMLTINDFRKKSLAQLIHYFYTEEEKGKDEIRHLICTNGFDWFIFEAQAFKKATSNYKSIHRSFTNHMFTNNSTDSFYEKVKQAEDSFFDKLKDIVFHFNLEQYANKNIDNKKDQHELVQLYKALSPYGILKEPHFTDANSLDKNFYEELLYILGLEETKHKIEESQTENTLIKLISKANPNLKTFDEKLRYILLIINRVLFLKLLEASLITMHPEDNSYHFLNTSIIKDFSKLKELFFNVLATKDRTNISTEFKNIPYLNSSLFEKQDDEDFIYTISNNDTMQTKDTQHYLPVLDYLMNFLSSYDFGASEDILQEESKPLINSAVLGLVFEKINSYKHGAHFTPESITSYMTDTSIKQTLINIFSRGLDKDIKTWEELKEITREDKELRFIFDKIKICDPAVGSGHFIVSALNKLIALKHELGLLCYDDGTKISRQDYQIAVENDELFILNERNHLFKYQVFNNKINTEVQKLQRSLFKEKRQIIENCLFGVDINSKSVMICQLRLWIELLKHSFYHVDEGGKPLSLETLPNIDINIKEGDSLISRYSIKKSLGVDETQPIAERDLQIINRFKELVDQYKNEINSSTKESCKREIEILKLEIQKPFIETKYIYTNSLIEANNSLIRKNSSNLFDISKKAENDIKKWKKENIILQAEADQLKQHIDDIEFNINALKRNMIKKPQLQQDRFSHSLEWRYEFPEILDEKGNFTGFDLVIMNPPYFALQTIKDNPYTNIYFESYTATGDIYQLFLERAFDLINDKGIVSAIVSNKWMRAGYGETTRKWLNQYTHVDELLDLGSGWFESATVDTNIIQYQKRENKQSVIKAYTLDNKAKSIFKGKQEPKTIMLNNSEPWIILSEIEAKILEKMNSAGKPLKDWDITINYGIKTGFNEAFIIDSEVREQLIKDDPKSEEIIKPLLRGRDIKRYGYEFADCWLINTHNGIKAKNIAPINVENYPAVKKHLDSHYSQLEKRLDKGETPYNLRNCAYLEDFDKPKIVYGEIVQNAEFTFDTSGMCPEATTFLLVGNHLEYLLAILNSKFGEYGFKEFFAGGGLGDTGFRYKKVFLEKFPIYVPTVEQEQEITKLVNIILSKKEQSLPTHDEESKIDHLVYQMYGLTDEEVQIINST